MAEPLTYQLLQSVRSCLREIKRSAGYHTNIGATVDLERGQLDRSDEDARIVVLSGAMTPIEGPAVRTIGRSVTVNILVQALAEKDEAELILHRALDDVDRAMANRQTRYPVGVTFPRFAGTDVVQPGDSITWISVLVRYTSDVRRLS